MNGQLSPSAHADDALRLVQAQYEASGAIFGSESPVEILKSISHFLGDTFHSGHLAFAYTESDPSRLRIVARLDGGDARAVDEPARLEAYPAFEALVALEALAIPDVDQDLFLTDDEHERLKQQGARAAIVVPLVINQRLTGLIFLVNDAPVILSPARLRALRSLADQMAVVFENRRLLADLRRRAEQLQHVASFGQTAQRTLSVPGVLMSVITETTEMLPVDRMYIALYEPMSRKIRVVGRFDGSSRSVSETGGPLISPDMLMMSRSLYNGKITCVHDLSAETDIYRSHELDDLRAFMVAPLSSRGQLLGAMSVGSLRPYAYSDTDVTIFQQMATQLGVALENARLFAQSQAQALREHKASEVANALMTATNMRSLLDLAAEQFNDAMGAVYTRITLQPDVVTETTAQTRGESLR
jgi:GAF domain-containing protein